MRIIEDGFEISGFYKSGTIRLMEVENGVAAGCSTYKFIAVDRYGSEIVDASDARDLVELNLEWWQGGDFADGPPADDWAELMVKYGLVDCEARTVVTYTPRRADV